MKEARIVADLSGYLTRILPSTTHEIVRVGGRRGVRLHLAQYRVDFLLDKGWWTPYYADRPYPGKARIAVMHTYPVLTLDIAFIVCLTYAHLATRPLASAEGEETGLRAVRSSGRAKLQEGEAYLRQIAGDGSTNPVSRLAAREALQVVDSTITRLTAEAPGAD